MNARTGGRPTAGASSPASGENGAGRSSAGASSRHLCKPITKEEVVPIRSNATRPFHNRMALVFDFDGTLAPDSFAELLGGIGVDPEAFAEERVRPRVEEGWEETLARFYGLVEESRSRDDVSITEDHLREVGRRIDLYEGVTGLFGRVRDRAAGSLPDVEVEFYLLSAGISHILRGTPIAGEFREVWGCEFHFDDVGEASFVKRLVTRPEKARYLLALAKGLDPHSPEGDSDIYREVPSEELHLPIDQVVYVGDGASDMPAFSLMNSSRGLALGVHKAESPERWSGHSQMREGRRIQNLAPADYGEGSELSRSLMLCVDSICARIALRKLGAGE